MSSDRAVLDGVIVIEMGSRISASVTGSILAELGATVIFLDYKKSASIFPNKFHFRTPLVAGKLSILINPDEESDNLLIEQLINCSDVIIYSSDTEPDFLKKIKSTKKIICDITSFGKDNPLSNKACSDVELQAMSGMLDSTGLPNRPPSSIKLPLIEQISGLYGACGVLCALRNKRLNNVAEEVIEVALYDVAFSAMSSFLAPAFTAQSILTRAGNRHTMAAPWNIYKASDGWVLICLGSDEQWQRICSIFSDSNIKNDSSLHKNIDRVEQVDRVDQLVQSWIETNTVAQCVDLLGKLGLPCGPIVNVDRFPQDPNLIFRDMIKDGLALNEVPFLKLSGSLFKFGKWRGKHLLRIPYPDQDRKTILEICSSPLIDKHYKTSSRPLSALSGVRIVEIGHYTTVPVAARTLAALGAEVIKVEPPDGEAVRGWPPAHDGQGIFFTFQNTDKQSVCIDLDDPKARGLLDKLIKSADVLMENLRPGALERKGYSIKKLHELNPKIIICSISGFGVNSLYPGRPAFDMVIQAMSGLMAVNQSDGLPLKTGPSICDVMGAVFGVVSVIAALEKRDRDGIGFLVDISMQDLGAWSTQTAWNGWRITNSNERIYACKDGHILVIGAKAQDLPINIDYMARAEAESRLNDFGIRATSILTISETLHSPQTMLRGLWFMATTKKTEFPLISIPLKIRSTPPVVRSPAPSLGADTLAWSDKFANTLQKDLS